MVSSFDFSQTPAASGPASHSAIVAGLQSSPLLSALSDATLAGLARDCHTKTFRPGDVLCHAQDTAQTIWLIMNNGWVKLTRETLGGAEAVWDILGQTALVGIDTLSAPHLHITTATAVTELEVLAIPHATLRRILEQTPVFAMTLLEYLARRTHQEHLAMEHLAQQTASQRIGCFLLKLSGTPPEGPCTLTLPFDKGLLAARLGMQPETFSRGLARLKQDIGMRMHGTRLHIPDMAGLSRYTCTDCSGSYPCAGGLRSRS